MTTWGLQWWPLALAGRRTFGNTAHIKEKRKLPEELQPLRKGNRPGTFRHNQPGSSYRGSGRADTAALPTDKPEKRRGSFAEQLISLEAHCQIFHSSSSN